MDIQMIIELALLAIVIIQFIVMVVLFSKNRQGSQSDVAQKLLEFGRRLDKNESTVRDEFGKNRDESNKSARASREELSSSLKRESEQLSGTITNFTGLVDKKIQSIMDSLSESSKSNREELSKSIASLTKETKDGLEKSRATVETKLADIQKDNSAQLDKMRQTVDEKLQSTLQTRLTESFKLVSGQLEQVQKGLGEMKNLASDVGDLKKVMSNVKTKGVLGEYQLGAILEQMLAPEQYEKNVKTKVGSDKNVEFAIKIPGRDDSGKAVYLPIDSKLPTSDYETLLDAYNSGDKKKIDDAQKAFARTVKTFAKEIRDKYIDPPNTTDFALLFLPFEGEYAEVVRDPELFESMQRDFKITVTGPSTISAFLNALQVGFRSIAVEKQTSKIWDILSSVKKEFGNFETVITKVKDQIDRASSTLETDVSRRTRAINKVLKKVETLPDDTSAQKLLEDASSESDDTEGE